MINKKDLEQPLLLSRYCDLLSQAALRKLLNGWQGIFRRTILALLPIGCLEKKFSTENGRPTKELYSMCGLLLIMEYFGWTHEQAQLNYMTDLGLQFALGIEEDCIELSERSLYRYIKIIREEEFAQKAMRQVTITLLKELNIDISEQHLDSSHVFSNMAAWSRRRLLHEIIQRFLKQVKRHAEAVYNSLDLELIARYESNNGWIFGETSPMKLQRNGKLYTTEEQMGYDMEKLMAHFSGNMSFTNMSSYKDLVQVFSEQFAVNDGKAELKKHPGGKILLNPSDREAEIGHKGVGYQVQIAETCSEKNEAQFITAGIPQGGSVSDMGSLPVVTEQLKEDGLLPEKNYADAGFGSDANYVYSAENGIELIAPTPPKPENKVGLDECVFDEDNLMLSCPAGNLPMFREYKDEHGRAVFHCKVCDNCPLCDLCRSQKKGKQNRVFEYDESDLRYVARRKKEGTEEFKKEYGSKRCPIEGLNGRLKQYTPLRRLRIRGRPAVYHSIMSILTMHNIMQAVRCIKIRQKNVALEAFCLFLRPQISVFSFFVNSYAA